MFTCQTSSAKYDCFEGVWRPLNIILWKFQGVQRQGRIWDLFMPDKHISGWHSHQTKEVWLQCEYLCVIIVYRKGRTMMIFPNMLFYCLILANINLTLEWCKEVKRCSQSVQTSFWFLQKIWRWCFECSDSL